MTDTQPSASDRERARDIVDLWMSATDGLILSDQGVRNALATQIATALAAARREGAEAERHISIRHAESWQKAEKRIWELESALAELQDERVAEILVLSDDKTIAGHVAKYKSAEEAVAALHAQQIKSGPPRGRGADAGSVRKRSQSWGLAWRNLPRGCRGNPRCDPRPPATGGTMSERELADWLVETCLQFGASVCTAYKVAGLFIEGVYGYTRPNANALLHTDYRDKTP